MLFIIYVGSVTAPDLITALIDVDSMVLLQCEFVGYLPSSHTVQWFDGIGNNIAPNDKYIITTVRNGSDVSVLSGEIEPGSNIISTLTITSLIADDQGTYNCTMMENGLTKSIKLVFEGMCSFKVYRNRIHVHFILVVDCDDPIDPDYGEVTLNSTEYLSVANYSCYNESRLIGSPQRTCSADGTWSGEAPICGIHTQILYSHFL